MPCVWSTWPGIITTALPWKGHVVSFTDDKSELRECQQLVQDHSDWARTRTQVGVWRQTQNTFSLPWMVVDNKTQSAQIKMVSLHIFNIFWKNNSVHARENWETGEFPHLLWVVVVQVSYHRLPSLELCVLGQWETEAQSPSCTDGKWVPAGTAVSPALALLWSQLPQARSVAVLPQMALRLSPTPRSKGMDILVPEARAQLDEMLFLTYGRIVHSHASSDEDTGLWRVAVTESLLAILLQP